MKRFVYLFGAGMLTVLSGLVFYLTWWAIWYRLPATDDEVIDMREAREDHACYITFCASLASNPHGFPGHAYVVWRTDPCADYLHGQARGYVPRYAGDQIRSLYTSVPGLLVEAASRDNMRNLETLTVIVDGKTYERTCRLASQWDANNFRAGDRDCVAFVDFVAKDIGLATFRPGFQYPRDHIRTLKSLNRNIAIRSDLNPCLNIGQAERDSSRGDRDSTRSVNIARIPKSYANIPMMPPITGATIGTHQ